MPEAPAPPIPPETDLETAAQGAAVNPAVVERAQGAGDDRLPLRVILFRVVIIVGVLVLGGAVFAGLKATAPRLDTDEAAAVRTRVLAYTPVPVPVRRTWRGYGTARALNTADVPARVTATVESVPDRVLEGASVQIGELLAQLDDRDFRAEVDRLDAALAEADATQDQIDTQQHRLEERLAFEREDLQIAEEELARVRRLNERDVTSTQDIDRARSALLAARRALTLTQEILDALPPRRAGVEAQQRGLQAQRRVAEQNYLRTRVTAPIAGVLQTVDVEPGESVAPGQRVARVVDPAVIEVPVRLPAAARRFLAVNDPVTLHATNQSGRAYEARLARISPEDDPQTRTVTAYALLNQENLTPADRLAPGMFVEVDVLTGEPTPRLVVPRRALRKQFVQALVDDGQGNTIVENRRVAVDFSVRGVLPETGLDDDQWAVLADGALPAGTPIMATSSSSLLPGEAVTISAAAGQRVDQSAAPAPPEPTP